MVTNGGRCEEQATASHSSWWPMVDNADEKVPGRPALLIMVMKACVYCILHRDVARQSIIVIDASHN